ncbi:MAG TPA: HAD-IA family hydrolase [Verrucomicrobiae bacterium]|nr:HAD-IA family hydrolase [Verrucomicrobiae bacterium]
MRDLQAVLFDLDDTLHDDTRAYKSAARRVARDVAARCGIDPEALERAYVAQAEGFWSNLNDEQLKTKLAGVRLRLWSAALQAVGVRDEEIAQRCADDYNRYRRESLELLPGAVELLRDLRQSGRKLGLLTNGFAETHREKIALLQLGDRFDGIFIADEVGMLKPDPMLFAHACEQLGVAPDATAMVGDRYERDIRGAHAAGLYTIWMNVRGDALPPGAPAPDATVPDLSGVRGALL